jgi:hypothetical protein
MKDDIAFLKAMQERLYADRFFGAADHYGLLLEKRGLKYSKGVVTDEGEGIGTTNKEPNGAVKSFPFDSD